MSDMQKEREAFEKWHIEKYGYASEKYTDSSAKRWAGWEARAVQEQSHNHTSVRAHQDYCGLNTDHKGPCVATFTRDIGTQNSDNPTRESVD